MGDGGKVPTHHHVRWICAADVEHSVLGYESTITALRKRCRTFFGAMERTEYLYHLIGYALFMYLRKYERSLYKKHTGGTLVLLSSSRTCMPTSKQRLNLTLPKHLALFLKQVSLRDEVPQATKAVQLLERALEWEEGEFKQEFVDEVKRRTGKDKLISAKKVFSDLW